MHHLMRRHLRFLAIFSLALASCGGQRTSVTAVKSTPVGAQVDLDMVSIQVANPVIIKKNDSDYFLQFNYTIDNQAGAIIAFLCLYNEIDDLIEINLKDKESNLLMLGKRPLEGLTLTEPRPLKIPIEKTIRSYQVPIMPIMPVSLESGEQLEMRVRLHAPSRYDELRSSIEASKINLSWP